MKKTRPIEIDGIIFGSIAEAAKAYNLSYPTFMGRIRRVHKPTYTKEDLGLEEITPVLTSTSIHRNAPTLSWDFVYKRIASSPIGRGVDSDHFPQAA